MAALFVAVSVLAAIRHSSPSKNASVPAPLAAGTALPRPRAVPAVQLTDSSGRPVSVRSWRGKGVTLPPLMPLCHRVGPMAPGVLMEGENRGRQAALARHVVVLKAPVLA